MNKIKYLFKVLCGARFKKMNDVLDQCKEKCGKSKIFMFFDIIWCAIRYGAGYYDYSIFAFYNMNAKQRDTYVTRMRNKKIISVLNRDDCDYMFDDKDKFSKRFEKFMRRDILIRDELNLESLTEFCKDKEIFFAKPNNGVSGRGIEKLKVADFESMEALLEYISNPEKDFGLFEEAIKQHPDINVLYPLAINTLRIVTLVDNDGQAHCIYCTLKMGDGGRFVDNLENGGMCVMVDRENSCLTGVAHTSRLEVLDKHPWTGVVFEGYKLPFINEAIEMCLEAAKVVPQIRFAGWDVAIAENGPCIVEGNNYPGYDFWQLPEQTPDKIGLMPVYRKLMPEIK